MYFGYKVYVYEKQLRVRFEINKNSGQNILKSGLVAWISFFICDKNSKLQDLEIYLCTL